MRKELLSVPLIRIRQYLAVALWIASLTACSAAGRQADYAASIGHPDTVRVLTYNIFAGNDLERRSNLERVAALIDTLRADIVLLQEVDRLTTRSGGVDQAAVLANATRMHVVFGRSIDFGGGHYGNAILSRWPILTTRVLPLDSLLPPSVAADVQEARTALHVTVQTPAGPVHVVNAHLDHRAGSAIRPAQALSLIAYLADAVPRDQPLILGGDLNATPDAVEVRALRARFVDVWTECGTGPGFTFRTDRPDRRIDYIMQSGQTRCVSARVVERPLSDHLPVFAEVLLRRN